MLLPAPSPISKLTDEDSPDKLREKIHPETWYEVPLTTPKVGMRSVGVFVAAPCHLARAASVKPFGATLKLGVKVCVAPEPPNAPHAPVALATATGCCMALVACLSINNPCCRPLNRARSAAYSCQVTPFLLIAAARTPANCARVNVKGGRKRCAGGALPPTFK